MLYELRHGAAHTRAADVDEADRWELFLRSASPRRSESKESVIVEEADYDDNAVRPGQRVSPVRTSPLSSGS